MIVDANNYVHQKAEGNFRIVSLVPSITELLFDLGLKDSIVGRTPFCIHPEAEVRNVKKIGGTKTLDVEKIMAVKPTHVVLNIDENKLELFEALNNKKVEIIVTHPNKPQDNLELFDLFSYIFSCEKKGKALSTALTKKFDALKCLSSTLTSMNVLYLIWKNPWMTVSSSTYISGMLKLIGWQTVPRNRKNRYPILSTNEITELDCDLCLLSTEPYPFKAKHIKEISMIRKNLNPIILVDGEKLSWYGSRVLKGIDYLLDLSRSYSHKGS